MPYPFKVGLQYRCLFKLGVNVQLSINSIYFYAKSLLLLVRLHDQSSSSDEVGGLLQVLQAPI